MKPDPVRSGRRRTLQASMAAKSDANRLPTFDESASTHRSPARCSPKHDLVLSHRSAERDGAITQRACRIGRRAASRLNNFLPHAILANDTSAIVSKNGLP